MSRRLLVLFATLLPAAVVRAGQAADPAAAPAPAPAPAAAAAPTTQKEVTDLLERFVTWLHHFFPSIDDQVFHWIAFGVVFVATLLLRGVIRNVIFFYLKKLAAKTETESS